MDTDLAGGPPDLIAYAWFQIGYRPRSSLILVGVRGPLLRTGLVARVDLPPPRGRAACVARLAAMVQQAGDDAVIALIVADAAPDGDLLAQRPLLRTVRQQVRRAGLGLLDVLAVGEDAYRSYLCDDAFCCPERGHPLAEVMCSSTAARMVLEGRVLGSGEDDVVADVLPDPEPVAGLPRRSRRPVSDAQRRRWMRQWRDELDGQLAGGQLAGGQLAGGQPGEPMTGSGTAWLVAALEDVRFRDALLVSLAAPDAADPFGTDPACLDTVTPRSAVLRAGTVLLAAVARAAPAGRRADALAALAWISWWSGGGARARLLCARTLADQPDHRLGRLIAQLLVAAVPPPWVEQADQALAPHAADW